MFDWDSLRYSQDTLVRDKHREDREQENESQSASIQHGVLIPEHENQRDRTLDMYNCDANQWISKPKWEKLEMNGPTDCGQNIWRSESRRMHCMGWRDTCWFVDAPISKHGPQRSKSIHLRHLYRRSRKPLASQASHLTPKNKSRAKLSNKYAFEWWWLGRNK